MKGSTQKAGKEMAFHFFKLKNMLAFSGKMLKYILPAIVGHTHNGNLPAGTTVSLTNTRTRKGQAIALIMHAQKEVQQED